MLTVCWMSHVTLCVTWRRLGSSNPNKYKNVKTNLRDLGFKSYTFRLLTAQKWHIGFWMYIFSHDFFTFIESHVPKFWFYESIINIQNVFHHPKNIQKNFQVWVLRKNSSQESNGQPVKTRFFTKIRFFNFFQPDEFFQVWVLTCQNSWFWSKLTPLKP